MNEIGPLAHAPDSEPELSRRVVSNTLVQFVPPALRIVLGIVLAAVLSRYLGVEGLGEYALVFTYVAVFNIVFNEWGLGTIVVRELSQRPEERRALLASATALQVLVSCACYGLMLITLAVPHYSQAFKNATMLFGLSLLLGPANVLALPFEADLRLTRLLVPSALQVVLNFTLSIAVVLLGGPLFALAGASLIAFAVRYVWTGYLGWRAVGLTATAFTSAVWRRWWALVREAWPIGAAATFKMTWQQGPILILGAFSLNATGLFNAANRVPQQLTLVPLALNTTMFPLLARSWVSDRLRFARQLERLVGGSLLIVVPAVIFGIAVAEPFVRVLFGAEFAEAGMPFAMLLAGSGLLFPIVFVAEALNAAGYQRLNLVITAALSPLLIALLFVLVPRSGASGAAFALLVCYGTYIAALLAGARWRLGGAAPVRALACASLAAALGGAALFIASPIGPVASGIVGAAVAVAAFGLVWPSIVGEYIRLLADWRHPAAASSSPAPGVIGSAE
jgi:O-antigen/teichoic acid export membrane protein